MRGKAEYVAAKLTLPGHRCPHLLQTDEKSERPIPSRLGFFHETGDSISFIETRKLCETCLRDAVPDGYNTWSTFHPKPGVEQVKDSQYGQARGKKWLDLPPSHDSYPPIFQAGTEGFTGDPAVSSSTRIGTTPVTMPMPQHPEAKDAWLWLKAESKPFYIDQLHLLMNHQLRLSVKWRPMAEKNAENDSGIAVKNGTLYQARAMVRKPNRGSMSITAAESLERKTRDQPILQVRLICFASGSNDIERIPL